MHRGKGSARKFTSQPEYQCRHIYLYTYVHIQLSDKICKDTIYINHMPRRNFHVIKFTFYIRQMYFLYIFAGTALMNIHIKIYIRLSACVCSQARLNFPTEGSLCFTIGPHDNYADKPTKGRVFVLFSCLTVKAI